MTILVLDDEVQPDYRYLGPEIERLTPDGEYHVYADDPVTPDLDAYDGVIISGSTASVYEEGHAFVDRQRDLVEACLDAGTPLLGICFGHQLVNDALGGRVEHRGLRAGLVEAAFDDDPLFEGVSSLVPAIHGDVVVEAGRGLVPIASVRDYDYPLFATRHETAPVWTVQFHPEIGAEHEPLLESAFDWDGDGAGFDDVTGDRLFENFGRLASRHRPPVG